MLMYLKQERDHGTPARMSSETVQLNIDGYDVSVPKGTSVMRAAVEAGIQVPKLCATDSLEPFGSCRLCLVEVDGRKGFPASCTTPAEAGMVVRTQTPKLQDLRKGVMELYISDHPLDCLKGKVVAWVGDGNNMANTWLQAADLLGFTVHVSTPSGYEVNQAIAGVKNANCFKVFKDPLQACQGADLVTTDVWTSMGFEAENEARLKAFGAWCVDGRMMAQAKPEALFMHCLPAHRGEEVQAEVIDGPQSVVWDEAENRLHVQKALMEWLLLGRL